MKHLFKEGNFRKINDRKVLKLENIDTAADILFDESLFNISSTIDMYDLEKLDQTEYYCIFKKYGKDKRISFDEVETSLRNILSGNLNDIINDCTSLGIPDKEIENNIFWDVNNNIIIVKGIENLKQICIELLMAGYERLGVKRNPENDEYFTSISTIPLIVKTRDLTEEKGKKLIKNPN